MTYKEERTEHEKARKMLAKFKANEKKGKRHTWMGHNLTVSHTDLKRLREIVEELGHEWDEGKVEKAKNRKDGKCE